MTDMDNEEQAQRVARRLLEAYREQLTNELSNVKSPSRWHASIPAWFAIALSIAGLIWNAAIVRGEVTDAKARITAIELSESTRSRDERQVLDRLTTIEVKLDTVIEKQKG